MKQFSQYFIVFGLSLLLFNSCSKDRNNPLDILTAKFEATVDGQSFTATTKFYNDNTGFLIITGQEMDGITLKKQIIITLPDIKTGTYTIGLDSIIAMTYQNKETDELYTGFSGTIDITKLEDNKVSGTFNFQATSLGLNTIQITDGVIENVLKVGTK
ncbi:MAG: hypothetical protein GXO79_06945 [Chlorobi bacterium]|nr:hypothetical protein [Chlorobiota bacterium]